MTAAFTSAGKGEGGWSPLVAGAVVEKAYELPDAVLHAVEARQRLYDFQPVTIPAETPLSEQLLDAARNRRPLPGADLASLDAIAEATARVAAREAIISAGHDARERAGWAVRRAISDHGGECLLLLRQAHGACVAAAQAAVEAIGTHGLVDTWPDEAPASVKKARAALPPVGARYQHIRAGRRALAAFLDQPRLDLDGEFAEMRNYSDLHTIGWQVPKPAPWDEQTDPAARLWMMLAMGADLWMPSPAEQDAAYAQRYPNSTRRTGGPPLQASSEHGTEVVVGDGPPRLIPSS